MKGHALLSEPRSKTTKHDDTPIWPLDSFEVLYGAHTLDGLDFFLIRFNPTVKDHEA